MISKIGKTFCGRTQQIVGCGPSECYRIEGRCRHALAQLIKVNREVLQSFVQHFLRHGQPGTADHREGVFRDYGDVVGSLVLIVAGDPDVLQ